MPPLTDPEVLRCYRNALANWRVEGYIVFLEHVQRWLRSEFEGYTQRAFKELLYRFVVEEAGEIDAVVERRENWIEHWSHHYDLRLTVDGRRLYIETRLKYRDPDDPDDPMIYVVNIHPA